MSRKKKTKTRGSTAKLFFGSPSVLWNSSGSLHFIVAEGRISSRWPPYPDYTAPGEAGWLGGSQSHRRRTESGKNVLTPLTPSLLGSRHGAVRRCTYTIKTKTKKNGQPLILKAGNPMRRKKLWKQVCLQAPLFRYTGKPCGWGWIWTHTASRHRAPNMFTKQSTEFSCNILIKKIILRIVVLDLEAPTFVMGCLPQT